MIVDQYLDTTVTVALALAGACVTAIVKVVRLEGRLATQELLMGRLDERFDRLEDKIDELHDITSGCQRHQKDGR